jgi:hypothetical protein
MSDNQHDIPDLATVKATLKRFAASRASAAQADAERDFGALLLYMVRLAASLEIDLIRAGEASLERAAASRPRLVSEQ